MKSKRKKSEADRQRKLKRERERLREYRQRIKQDPEKRELERERRRLSYLRQKKNKDIKNQNSKFIGELTLYEVNRRRRRWRISAKKYRERKKKLKECSMIDEDSLSVKEEEKIDGNRNLRIIMDGVQQSVEIKTEAIIKEELDLESDFAEDNFADTEVVETSKANPDIIEEKNHTGRRQKSPTKKMRSACLPEKCKLSCGQGLIPEEKRVEIFHNFWKLPTHTEKWKYISRNIELAETKKRTPRSRRNYNRYYCFEIDGRSTRVCKNMFEATLGVSSTWISKALSEDEKKELPKRTMRSMCEFDTCKLSCGKRLIGEEERKTIFEDFWKLSDFLHRSEYIGRHIELTIAENEAAEMYETVYLTRRYFFEIDGKRLKVCKKTFTATLGITDQIVSDVVRSLHKKEVQADTVHQKRKCFQKNFDVEAEAPTFLFVDTDALGDTEEMDML